MAYRFERLEIWKTAIEYAKRIYQLTENFQKHEVYGLTSQLRRAAVSVSSNIAEGSASDSDREFRNFLNYAIRSVAEIVSELNIAKAMGYLDDKEFRLSYDESEVLIKRITSFRKTLS